MKLMTKMNFRLILIVFMGLFVLLFQCTSNSDNKKTFSLREIYQSGMTAYQDSNYTDYLNAMKRANDLRPNHPSVIYNIASGQALTGNHDSALFWLNRFADLGMTGQPEHDNDFKSLYSDPLFQAVAQRINNNSLQVGEPTIILSLPDSTLITEGVAYDPRSGNFFISSIHQRKIVTVDAKGASHTFVPSGSNGLGSVSGVVVDTMRNLLWAASAVTERTPPVSPAELGQTGVFAFDLATGELRHRKIFPPDSIPHSFGDIATGTDGEIYLSDDQAGAIYWFSLVQNQFIPVTLPKAFTSPQGVIVEPSGKSLIVADYTSGLYHVDLKSGELTPVEPTEPMCLLGIDGLCSEDQYLYAIQNGIRPHRVVKLTLNPSRTQVIKLDILAANHPDFDEPTLGVIANGKLYFNGNSQWRFLNKNGTLSNLNELQRPKIFSVPL